MEFSELKHTYFTISDLFAVRQTASGKKHFEMINPRPTDALMLFLKAKSICYQNGEQPLNIPVGALVYIPKGSRYIWEDEPAFEDGVIEKLLFEFALYPVNTQYSEERKITVLGNPNERISFGSKIRIISTNHTGLFNKYFERIVAANQQENAVLEMFASAYDLLNIISQSRGDIVHMGMDYHLIENGIRYIQQNPLTEKSIGEIAAMCGVCIGYFERLFKNWAKITPREYISNERVLLIKKMLQDKLVCLEEIAEKMSFCDSAYLCRFFKNKTGMSPMEYRKMFFSQIENRDS